MDAGIGHRKTLDVAMLRRLYRAVYRVAALALLRSAREFTALLK
jgi:hypothetical protein